MKLISKIGFSTYWVFALVNALFIYLNIISPRYVTQTLLVPILFITIISQIHPHKYKSEKLAFSLALLFCMVGDILLINNNLLMSGLILYSLAQLCYSIFFLNQQGIIPLSFIIITLIAAALIGLVGILYGEFTNILISYLYQILIVAIPFSILVFTTFNMLFNKKFKNPALNFFIPATLLWGFSYLLLFLNFFLLKEEYFYTFNFLLYASAQFYFAKGIIDEMQYDTKSNKKRKRKLESSENISLITNAHS